LVRPGDSDDRAACAAAAAAAGKPGVCQYERQCFGSGSSGDSGGLVAFIIVIVLVIIIGVAIYKSVRHCMATVILPYTAHACLRACAPASLSTLPLPFSS
jgi:type IV secretory pathway VirB6-like protein